MTSLPVRYPAVRELEHCTRRCKISIDYDFSPSGSWPRAEIYDMVCFPYGFLIMLHHDDSISHISEMFQGLDKFFIISWMQSNGRFIQYVGDPDQATAYLRS